MSAIKTKRQAKLLNSKSFIFYFDRTEETAIFASSSDSHSHGLAFAKTTIHQKTSIKQQNPHNKMLMVEENKR